LRFAARKRLKSLEVSERRQVGDAESLVHRTDDGGAAARPTRDDSEL